MNFKEIILEPFAPVSYLKSAKRIMEGDPKERNESLMHKKSCEFLVETGSENLLICIGESWTWGEGLMFDNGPNGSTRQLASGIDLADPVLRIEDTWPGKMARMMGTDLHIHSVPGNSNHYHIQAFERILKNIEPNKYKNVFYVVCLTDIARDFTGDFVQGDPRYKLFVDKHSTEDIGNNKLTFEEWIEAYDAAYFEKINQLENQYEHLNLSGCLWKNFNNFKSPKRDNKFKVIELPYIRWAAKMCGLDDIELPVIQAAEWWQNHCNYKILKERPSIDYINQQLDILEKQYRFIQAVPTMISELNRTHPNYIGHWAWAIYLCSKMNWINE